MLANCDKLVPLSHGAMEAAGKVAVCMVALRSASRSLSASLSASALVANKALAAMAEM